MKISPSLEFPDQKREYVDNIQVNYYEAGKGLPLVLLHGWPQTSLIWRKIIPALQTQYRIIAVELPGMGNNKAAKSADTLTVARFLKTFLHQINIDHFHFVAHDIGAWVAVTFALEFEQSLKSLSVLDAGIPGLIPDEIFNPVNAKKIWQFYFHAIEDIPEFLLAGKEAEYLNWYFKNKTFVKDALSDEVISHYIQCYTGKENLKYGFEYYRAFIESARQNLAYNT